MVPARIVAEAIEHNVSFGNRHERSRPGSSMYRQFEPKLASHFTTKSKTLHAGDPIRLPEFLDCELVDTMFEFSLFCFCADKSYVNLGQFHKGYEMGGFVVHFRGPESVHRDCPEIYNDAKRLDMLPRWYDERLNDRALMFLLAGVFQQGDDLRKWLLSATGLPPFAEKVVRLERHAGEWMSSVEHGKFQWVKQLIEDHQRS